MDPFTLALATFGVQKLRGKSTKRALRDAALIGGGSYALGASGIGGCNIYRCSTYQVLVRLDTRCPTMGVRIITILNANSWCSI